MPAGTVIAVPRETAPGEKRCALLPSDARRLIELGAQVEIEAGLGDGSSASDDKYRAAGAKIIDDLKTLLARADVVLRVNKPPLSEADCLKPGSLHVSFLNPFVEQDLLKNLAARGISVLSMDMMPRNSRAQGMDALTSQANLAGYVAVILAARYLNQAFPMMTTAAGTIQPARVLVIGAGVAGLQAIATAHRLGARVEAYDTRPGMEEQVRSLGARFLKIELGTSEQTTQGYAKALTGDQLRKQHNSLKQSCVQADVVVTAAQVFGKTAPLIITADMLDGMKQGSVVVDLAVESGGNVEGVEYNQLTERNGISIVGYTNLPGRVPVDASQQYSANLTHLITEFWDKQNRRFALLADDEILQSCLIAHEGKVLFERTDEPSPKESR